MIEVSFRITIHCQLIAICVRFLEKLLKFSHNLSFIGGNLPKRILSISCCLNTVFRRSIYFLIYLYLILKVSNKSNARSDSRAIVHKIRLRIYKIENQYINKNDFVIKSIKLIRAFNGINVVQCYNFLLSLICVFCCC